MSYQVLARKWRPRNFHRMVGQASTLRMLSNALEQNRLHHAYLFTGTRGVGKTTIARILAKCLNCEKGITSTPCDTCGNCLAIDAGKFLDLFEVDAASRTKVEDTRELLENVQYPPSQGRFKVYLIDEVHMLSNHSFNALLKTLEEPPEHVKFLLATTDPKKLPITVLSRCLQFHLKRISPQQICQHLTHICETENLNHEVSALQKIAQAADGSMRDALSLLDQAIAYGHGTVQKSDVDTMLGCMAQEDLLPLIHALAAEDGDALFTAAHALMENAPDCCQLLESLIDLFYHLAMAQILPAQADEHLLTLANQFNPEDLQVYYQIALLSRRDLTLSPSPQQGFDMCLLRLLTFAPQQASVAAAPKPLTKTRPTSSATQKSNLESSQTTPKPLAAADANTAVVWRDILPKLELTGMAYALAANCTVKQLTGERLTLALSATHGPMLNPKLKERLTSAVVHYFKKPIALDIVLADTELLTPAIEQQQAHKAQISQVKDKVLQHPNVKKLVDTYDATVEVSLHSSS